MTQPPLPFLLLPLAFLLGSPAPRPPRIVLPGYSVCSSALIEETGNGLSYYSKIRGVMCIGKLVLAYEKYLPSPGNQPRYEIVDTVHVTTAVTSREMAITHCTTASGKRRLLFVMFKRVPDEQMQFLSHLRRAWGVNAKGRLVEVPVKTLQCLNE